MEPQERFGRNLREHRLRLGMSQEELAQAAGLHPTEVSRLERAVQDPRLSTIARLARALQVEPGGLLRGVG